MQETMTDERQGLHAERILDGIVSEQLYEQAVDCLSSPQERLLFQASFEWNLRPGMIVERWPGTFANAREVYRVRERILRRLRRDDALRHFLEMDCENGGNRG